jgi:methylenetetrahydrofolate dehydrogenase (NADP+) / methenyltetrahydrofolate cyclohydrolase
MKIDGKRLAEDILSALEQKIKTSHITPTLAVLQIGDDPASVAYIRQKQKAADRIGANIVISKQGTGISVNELQELTKKFTIDPTVHGLIIQRPIPHILHDVARTVSPEKDIDGFLPHSPYAAPVALAVSEILQEIYISIHNSSQNKNENFTFQIENFEKWLQSKQICIIGRGETAGKPIADYFTKLDCTTSVISSQTHNPEEILKQADIIISCVGKARIIKNDYIKPGVILLSVGIWRDELGKLHGDYDEDEILDTALYYTPTPGGVGPINVACLMQNLVKACTIKVGGNL